MQVDTLSAHFLGEFQKPLVSGWRYFAIFYSSSHRATFVKVVAAIIELAVINKRLEFPVALGELWPVQVRQPKNSHAWAVYQIAASIDVVKGCGGSGVPSMFCRFRKGVGLQVSVGDNKVGDRGFSDPRLACQQADLPV